MQASSLDLRFLEQLKQRLQLSNRRSIYLNALAGRSRNRLNLTDLNQIEPRLAERFIALLLGKPNFRLQFRPRAERWQEEPELGRLMRRLNNMLLDHQDHLAEQGVATFGFGFPIILKRDQEDPSRIIKAPLFVWSLELKRNWRKSNEWTLERSDEFALSSNRSLAAHLLKDMKIRLSPRYDHFMEDGLLDERELMQTVVKQLAQLSPEKQEAEVREALLASWKKGLAPLPTLKDELLELTENGPKLVWGGLFGLYKGQKESLAQDIQEFIQRFDELGQLLRPIGRGDFGEQAVPKLMQHSFPMLPTDPSQQHLLHDLFRGKQIIVQGPPGTGKSQSLTAVLSNLLSNGARCLVVCEKKTALDVLYNNLKELGLEELAVIVEDLYRDRGPLVRSMRARLQQKQKSYKPSSHYLRSLQSMAAYSQQLQGYHEQLLAQLSGEKRWSDLVDEYLELSTTYDRKRIAGQLNPKAFSFENAELEEILRILEEGEPLFRALGSLQHPFNAFSDHFFSNGNTHAVKQELGKKLRGLQNALDAAQSDLLSYLYEYEKLLEDHYSETMSFKGKALEEMRDLIEDGFETSKYFFNKNKGFYRSLLRSVSSKYKKLQDDKEKVLAHYKLLRSFHQRYNYFDFPFLKLDDIDIIIFEDVQKNIGQYSKKLSDWYFERSKDIQRLVNELSLQNMHPHVDFKGRVQELSRNLDIFAESYRKSKIFKVGFRFDSPILRQRLNHLENLYENLGKLLERFEAEFEAYHRLKFFWEQLNTAERQAFRALSEANPPDWQGHFRCWYIYELLERQDQERLPQAESYARLLKYYEEEQERMRKELKQHTLLHWRAKQAQAVDQFNREKAPLKVHSIYNLRGANGGKRTPLRQIFEADPQLFSSFFPVLMVNPSVAAAMLPLTPHLFDVVIFDEASQLRLEDTFSALLRGRLKVISGDSQQMPPSDYFASRESAFLEEEEEDENAWELEKEAVDYLAGSESLLEYSVADGRYEESFLQIHYRSRHPYLIDFSNAAFYGKRLRPVPAQEDYCPIEFRAINGLYENSTNPTEAEAILEELLVLYEQHKAQLPAIGVATFNLKQRNLILEKMQERMSQSETEANAFEALQAAGLFVKNLENIQGDERDILLLSTTFGQREDGRFIQNFGPINRERGYRLLNVLISRAKQKIVLFSSIPQEYILRYRELIPEQGNYGKAIFYAYLAYAQAVSLGNEALRQQILELVYTHSDQKQLEEFNPESRLAGFALRFHRFLSGHLPEGYQLDWQAQLAGLQIPFLLRDGLGRPKLAFFIDLYHADYSEEAYAWDFFRRDYLRRMNIPLERVWTYSWWKQPEAEQARIRAILQALG
ncbi:hypothetical protein SapgrDRAFT_2526 [Saprospira grandis DSM 2844]|uniref:DNA2/NAM7 helicase-like C-terminal domain-containing protein n=1 Tax=Saprospira grandis DSM 2844 TaxID=694433 RepID=J1I602_9BACT|nr:AAA domain-containing protein [Saprospira grandis]EJF54185.1 hypothetical protein SapgrDRAFT_2526 [Saprospira grandis DSM 2844]